jgi:GNAT superfamily N-acetyltransferase
MRAKEFILEDTMPELEYDRSLNYSEERNGVKLRAWIEEAGRLEISASIDGQEVGSVSFINFGDHLQASTVEVKPEFRRRGIARMMYDFAEELGNDLEPSHALTDPGKEFWRNRDPEADIVESVDFAQMPPQQIASVSQDAFAQIYPGVKLYSKSTVEGIGLSTQKGGAGSASAWGLDSNVSRDEFYITLNAYAEGTSMIVVIEDATAGKYKGAATAVIKSLFEAGERLYNTEQRELVINDNSNYEAWSTIADRVGAEMMESQVQEAVQDKSDHSYTTAYHITGLENAEEIMYKGLDPRDGKAFLVVDEGNPQKLRDELYQVYGWLDAKAQNKDEEFTLLKVDVRGAPLAYEFGWHFSTARVPASRIQDLGPDALRKYV